VGKDSTTIITDIITDSSAIERVAALEGGIAIETELKDKKLRYEEYRFSAHRLRYL
jgi:hypothetical protein